MKIVNPYEGVDWTRTVRSITHEHIHNATAFANAYNRGIRHFAAMSYSPASPRFPASNYWLRVVDGEPVSQTYKDFNDLPNGDLTIVDKTLKGSVTQFTDSNGNVVFTDDIPQIPNNEHPTFTRKIGETTTFLNHFNVLGSMWGEAGWGANNGTTADRAGHPICDLDDMANFANTTNQYWKGKLFVTINHCRIDSAAEVLLSSRLGNYAVGFEVFNQGFTREYNASFRSCWDKLLSAGYRLNGVAVIDWQGYIEKDKLPSEDITNYIPEADYDRGCNVLLVDAEYDNLPANDFIEIDGKKYPNFHSSKRTKAEAGLDCYINGKYYASGLGNHQITELSTNGDVITFRVDGSPSKITAITNKGEVQGSGSAITYKVPKGVSYVRFEVFYNNDTKKDFIFTNPIYVEDNIDVPVRSNDKHLLLLE